MKRLRNATAGLVLTVTAAMPLPACAPGGPMGAVGGLVMSIGASVGSYLLIKELT